MLVRFQLRPFVLGSLLCAHYLFLGGVAAAQVNTVTVRVEIRNPASATGAKKTPGASNLADVVVWLKPLDRTSATAIAAEQAHKPLQLIQKNKSFQPHLLVVPVGSSVDFPNHDPFFHNVFSLFDGKRFDLGLYEAGSSNSVRFDRVGVSFLFCNIHPEMSAVVVAVDTPYYAKSDPSGNLSIPDVPDGRYMMHVWYEGSLPEDLKLLSKIVAVSPETKDLGTIRIPQNPNIASGHKNKYGQDYTPPPAPSYSHP